MNKEMKTKNIYYEHDEASGTSIGVKYEKYLYRCQSKFQNIEVIKTHNYGNALYLDGCFMLSEINQDYYHNMCLDLTCLLYTSPSPRDCRLSRMPSSA